MPAERESASPAESMMTAPGTSGIAPRRIPDIAVEVRRLSGAVRVALPQLAFGDEPSDFAALLERAAR